MMFFIGFLTGIVALILYIEVMMKIDEYFDDEDYR